MCPRAAVPLRGCNHALIETVMRRNELVVDPVRWQIETFDVLAGDAIVADGHAREPARRRSPAWRACLRAVTLRSAVRLIEMRRYALAVDPVAWQIVTRFGITVATAESAVDCAASAAVAPATTTSDINKRCSFMAHSP
jgi:hypothetical protein